MPASRHEPRARDRRWPSPARATAIEGGGRGRETENRVRRSGRDLRSRASLRRQRLGREHLHPRSERQRYRDHPLPVGTALGNASGRAPFITDGDERSVSPARGAAARRSHVAHADQGGQLARWAAISFIQPRVLRVGIPPLEHAQGAERIPTTGLTDLLHLKPGSALVTLLERPTTVRPAFAGDNANGV